MNKKIKTEFAIGIILILAFLVGGAFWLGNKKSFPIKNKGCTMEAKVCPDGTSVGRTGPNCEFSPCPENILLAKGYTLDKYTIVKKFDIKCTKNSDCQTPSDYIAMSNCPYTSLCLENKCNVFCPAYIGSDNKDKSLQGTYKSVKGVMDPLSCYCNNGGYLTTSDNKKIPVCFEDTDTEIKYDAIEIHGNYKTVKNNPEPTSACRAGSMTYFSATSYSSKKSEQPLKSCANGKACDDGYICYDSQYGAMGPDGPVIGSQEGDLLCHKECKVDKDCGNGQCKTVELMLGDIVMNEKFCTER